MILEDTIAAIATPPGMGGISVIRVSGPEAINKVNSIFKGKNLEKVKTHTINFGKIINNKGEVLDEVLVSVFIGPNSFTGENVCEVSTHGGILITNLVLEAILDTGIRMAEPGEFTKRAFLNRRIDLVQAEAVMDLISAESSKAAKVAIKALSGDTSNLVEQFSHKVLSLLAEIEVNIDYPEYDETEELTKAVVLERLNKLISELEEIITKSNTTRLIKQGINTAIIGRTNVGKSSLLNALLNEERAIVTNIAGTTRDIIDGFLTIDGVGFRLIDTAGIRKADDTVEKIGIERSKKAITEAELVLLVLDASVELTNEDQELLTLTEDKERIIILNKDDLPNKIGVFPDAVSLSALEKRGLDNLHKKIIEMFNLNKISDNEYRYLSNTRHIQILKESLNILKQMQSKVTLDLPIDFLSLDLNQAYLKLGEITGKSSYEEFLHTLFSNFCLGK